MPWWIVLVILLAALIVYVTGLVVEKLIRRR